MNWNNVVKYFLALYSLILLAFCFCIIPNSDSYYYWGWSKNLQLSYFDGPPMIGYVIRASTALFGNTVFAINLVGVVVILLSYYIVYQIAKLLLSKQSATIVALFWLLYPFMITRYIVVNVTYDGLENMFNLLVLFFALKFIQTRRPVHLYFIGIAGGFLLLSKYSGILSLVALIGFFIYQTELRKVFREPHVYLAILICFLLFSPVLIWNYQHQFASFTYQLHHHAWAIQAAQSAASDKHGFGKMWYYLGSAILAPLSICFILIAWVIIVKKASLKNIASQLESKLILTIAGIIFIFWLCMSPFFQVNLIYTLYFSSLVIIFTGYLLSKACQNKILVVCVVIGVVCSIQLLIHFSLVAQSVENYRFYVGNGLNQLRFNSPLLKYIK